MGKRVFIVHGWSGSPEGSWFPWLRNELQKKGFTVFVPAMPETDNPRISVWVSHLSGLVGNPDGHTYFVGHSIGCQTILRYLETIDTKVGGCIFVAGWFNLLPQSISTDAEKAIARPWLETPIDFEKVKQNANRIVAIFSDNDDCVPISDERLFKKKLNAETHMEHLKGHFSADDGIKKLPIALESILEVAQ